MLDLSVLDLWHFIIGGGFVVGFLVGMTGVGAGSLMTPFLITQIGVSPPLAVGTDLLFASLTKASAALPHHNFGNVNWRIVKCLAAGSIPGSIATLVALSYFEPDTAFLALLLKQALVIALVLSSTAIVFYPFITRNGAVADSEVDNEPIRRGGSTPGRSERVGARGDTQAPPATRRASVIPSAAVLCAPRMAHGNRP